MTTVLKAAAFLPPGVAFHVAAHRLGEARSGTHTHRGFAEFFLVTEGAVRHVFNGSDLRLSSRYLALVRERDEHLVCGPPKGAGRILNVAFPLAVAQDTLRFLGLPHAGALLEGPGRPLGMQLPAQQGREFARRLEAACAIFPTRETELRAMLAEVFSRCLASVALAEHAAAPPEWLLELCEFLRRPEGFRHAPRELPRLAHKSAEHLARSFRRHLGLTPTDYLNTCRLDHAARQLAGGDEKLLAIAADCAFENAAYFHRLFRRRFGMTPRRYRLRARQLVRP